MPLMLHIIGEEAPLLGSKLNIRYSRGGKDINAPSRVTRAKWPRATSPVRHGLGRIYIYKKAFVA